ncbi:hypothetical protein DEU42_1127 [Flavobacterium sp. AG291]|nr:hypothetical protein DEU42_1127 [Flavobacterium sp. AG291]
MTRIERVDADSFLRMSETRIQVSPPKEGNLLIHILTPSLSKGEDEASLDPTKNLLRSPLDWRGAGGEENKGEATKKPALSCRFS